MHYCICLTLQNFIKRPFIVSCIFLLPLTKAISIENSLPIVDISINQKIFGASSCGSNMNKTMENQTKSDGRNLAAFDFDHTIVEFNTDTVVADLISIDKIPKDLPSLIDRAGWTEYMAEIFRLLRKHNVKPAKILDSIRGIPEVPGFVRLIKHLKQNLNFDVIIISDSNSIFIEEWLRAHGLTNAITAIYTNPAQFNDDDLLTIKPYHNQTECKLSSANLCKGKVLEHFIVEQDLRHNLRYNCIVYVGDGNNDVCPVLRLRTHDIACVRQGFPMDNTLMKKRDKMKVRADILTWKNGFDLLEQLEKNLKRKEF